MVNDRTAARTMPTNLTNAFPESMEALLQDAMQERATDIHIDPLSNQWIIRFRVDGMIYQKQALTGEAGYRLVNQLKVASRLEVEKSFLPLNSQLEYYYNNEKKDLRVTILPAEDNEPVHLRILSPVTQNWEINRLGFTDDDRQIIDDTLASPRGLILVSGRTGSGKTTTLYSLVSTLDLKERIAVSIEDPIEYSLPFLRQMEVDEDHGLTMHGGLRTLVRMDPDVILVGEIRDEESASIATRAAVGGRLVLATIHAGDAARTVEALHYYDIPYHVIGSCLRLIISQELARRLCRQCAQVHPPTQAEKAMFEPTSVEVPDKLFEAVGCDDCGGYGYKGRIGIFETVGIDRETEEIIAGGTTYRQLRDRFNQCNMVSALEDSLKKAVLGDTTVQEIMRIF